MSGCIGCVICRVSHGKTRFCNLYCKPDNMKYFINDDWSAEHPSVAPICQLIANYFYVNGESKTLEMMRNMGYTQSPTKEKIIAAIKDIENGKIK